MNRRIARKIKIADAVIRYNDDIRSLYLMLKSKVKEAIAFFKSLPPLKKVVQILAYIVEISGGLITGANIANSILAAKKIRMLYNEAQKTVDTFVEMPGSDEEIATSGSALSYFSLLKNNKTFIKAVMKTIGGLVMAICGYVLDVYAKS